MTKVFNFTKAEQIKNAEPVIKLFDAIVELEKELARTRRPTLKELAEQFHADAMRHAPLSRLRDDQRRMYQEALAIVARVAPYELTKGIYIETMFNPEQLKALAKHLCRIADNMRASQRRREANQQQHADWKETREILGD